MTVCWVGSIDTKYIVQSGTWSDSLPLRSWSSREYRDHSFNTSLDVKGVSLTNRLSSSRGSWWASQQPQTIRVSTAC